MRVKWVFVVTGFLILSAAIVFASINGLNLSKTNFSKSAKNNFQKKLNQYQFIDLKKMKQEIHLHPDQPPQSMLVAADQLKILRDQVSNDKQGEQFLEKVSSCLSPKSGMPLSFQAVCLKYASDIARSYPSLKLQYVQIKQAASHAVKNTVSL